MANVNNNNNRIIGLEDISPFVIKQIPSTNPLRLESDKLEVDMRNIIQAWDISFKILKVLYTNFAQNKNPIKFHFTITSIELSDDRIIKAIRLFFLEKFNLSKIDIELYKGNLENLEQSIDPQTFPQIIFPDRDFLSEHPFAAITVACDYSPLQNLPPASKEQMQKSIDAELFKAVYEGLTIQTFNLLKMGARINAIGPFGRTPLFFARFDLMKMNLNENGAQPDFRDEKGMKPSDVTFLLDQEKHYELHLNVHKLIHYV